MVGGEIDMTTETSPWPEVVPPEMIAAYECTRKLDKLDFRELHQTSEYEAELESVGGSEDGVLQPPPQQQPTHDLRKPEATANPTHGPPRTSAMLSGHNVLRFLGRGSMGVVALVEHGILRRHVALKVMRSSNNPSARARMMREARALARVEHPNVVKVYDCGQSATSAWVAMEYIPGHNLLQLIRERGPLDLARSIHIGARLASALGCAHRQGLVHRDVKPSNIIISQDEAGRDRPVLLDFGIVKPIEPGWTDITGSPKLIGTIAYMAPEQMYGEDLDPSADVFALAIVIYEMLLGQRPSGTGNLTTRLDNEVVLGPLPGMEQDATAAGLHALLTRCVSRECGDRPANGEVLYKELMSLYDDSPEVEAATPAVATAPRVLMVSMAAGVLAAIPMIGVALFAIAWAATS